MTPIAPIAREGFQPVIFAKDQPQYIPLPAITDGNRVETRWSLSWRERFLVLFKGSVHLSLLTFGGPLQPIRITVERDEASGAGHAGGV